MLLKGRKYSYVCFIFCLLLTTMSGQVLADDDTGNAPVGLDVVVVEDKPGDGSAKAGYRVEDVHKLGPWGSRKTLDTPYTISVMGSELIKNLMAKNPEQLYRVNPTTFSGSYELNANNFFYTRGFVGNYAYVDGIPNENINYGMNLEDIDRVELLSGLSGFFYGMSQVGGTAAYNLKRPTAERLTTLEIGDYGTRQFYVHGDAGGPIAGGKFGYRLNAMYQDGDTDIRGQSLERALISGAFDWNISNDLQVQFNFGYSKFYRKGQQMPFEIRDNNLTHIPSPPNPAELWAPEGTFSNVEGYYAGVGIKYRINEIFKVRTAFNHKDDTRKMIYTSSGYLNNLNDDYWFDISGGKWRYISNGGYLYLDSDFETLGLKHTLTVGGNGAQRTNKTAVFNNNAIFLFGPGYTYSLSNPSARYVSVPNWDLDDSRMATQLKSSRYSLIIGDDIRFNEYWSMLAGVNYTRIMTKNYNPILGSRSNKYNKEAFTPSASLIFKPLTNVSTYATYIEGLEPGQVVGWWNANAGEITAPLRSRQYEIGAKAEVARMLLTGALFYIDKPYGYTDNFNVYVQNGRQVHQGLELTSMGKLTDNLTLWSGLTFLNPKIKKADDPKLKGTQAQYVPRFMGKLYAEYGLPFMNGLTLTGAVQYIGSRYANTYNTNKLHSYITGDLGARYTTDILGVETSFRLNATNIADTRYWLDQSLGHGRSVMFSVQCNF